MKSTISDSEYCLFCGRKATQEHHLIFGSSGRAFAEKYGLKIPICVGCHTAAEFVVDRIHDNAKAERLSKMLGQAIYERDRALEGMQLKDIKDEFLKENGGFYL